jgi:hypothetical protein
VFSESKFPFDLAIQVQFPSLCVPCPIVCQDIKLVLSDNKFGEGRDKRLLKTQRTLVGKKKKITN